MTAKRSDTDFDLCQFAFSDGRHCGLPGLREFNGLCRSHGQLEKFRKSQPAEHNEYIYLEPFTSNPPTEDEIHGALSAVFRALAADRISTRRAATFGYLGQLLLLKKGSKEARENINNLSRIFIKTLDVAYNPKYSATLNPAIQAQDSNSAPPPPSTKKPSTQSST